MAHHHVETNPHFIDSQHLTPEQHQYLPPPLLPKRGHDRDRRHQQRVPAEGQQPPRVPAEVQQPPQEQRPQPLARSPPEGHHEDQPHPPLHLWVPPPHHEGPHHQPVPPHHQGQHPQQQQPQPLGMWAPMSQAQGPVPKKQKRQGRPKKEVVMQPQLQDQHPSASLIRPHGQSPEIMMPTPKPKPHGRQQPPDETRPHSRLFLPRARRTKPHTWCAAVFCIIFWLAIIIGGLIVLVVYLVFKPRGPRFDVTSVTLNAAYLDMDYLLNADLTLLANFTNPNKKVKIDFSSMYIDLYFDNTMIATQYIPPFSAQRSEYMLASIHMVTSQVRLSTKESLLLKRQIESNRVHFTVKGMFRTRSNFGSVWSYSYWLRGRCDVIVSSPPTGVLKQKLCKTKH